MDDIDGPARLVAPAEYSSELFVGLFAGHPPGMGSDLLAAVAAVADRDLSLLFVLVALVCFGAAAYLAYLRNALGAILLVFVGIVALLFGT